MMMPTITTIGGTVVAVGLASLLGPIFWRDYNLFMSYGPGGLPHNALGWVISGGLLRMMSVEMLSTARYVKSSDKRSWLPQLSPPPRAGSRPQVGSHPVPQRQLTQIPDEEIKATLIQEFDQLAVQNEESIERRESVLETHAGAIFLREDVPASSIAQGMLREISHVHSGGDHSVHVTLSPQDCIKVVDAGWGLRHGLAGVESLKLLAGFALSYQYILLYAPRDKAEIKTVMEIVQASISYMSDIQVVE